MTLKIDWAPGSTPYAKIIDLLRSWANDNYFDDMVACIIADGQESNELVCFNSHNLHLYFDNDWWEGQKDIYLIGFIPISEVAPGMKWREI